MKKQDPNSLTGYIRAKLQDHEEPYRLGAWQEFQRHQTQKKRRSIFKKVSAAAASLLLASLLFLSWTLADREIFYASVEQPATEIAPDRDAPSVFGVDELPDVSPEVSVNGITEQRSESPDTSPSHNVDLEPIDELSADTEPPVYTGPNRNMSLLAGGIDSGSFPGLNSAMMASKAEQVLSAARSRLAADGEEDLFYPGKVEFTSVKGNLTAIEAEDKDEIIQLAAYTERQLPGHEEQYLQIKTERSISLPKLGLGYVPHVSMHQSTADFGMGAGIHIDWELASGLYLSSGFYLAQNRLEINEKQSTEFLRTTMDNYDHIETAARLLSVEIPITLRYRVANNVFASIGISSATFLDENYEYRFQYQQEQERVVLNDEDELQKTMTTVLITETQSQSEPSFNTFHLPAFYTVSVGYQQPVFEKRILTVEPFLKVPAGRLATRGIRYSAAGVQMMVSL